ncbi:scarecrow-like protein 15 [Punica granatum]|uniref:Scarecrow-like protein 15 n=1 Tax=Punica granatum TaxID=22663 RepID=A0A218W276_PUNGR|nr:scarecrow-like protein 15 [Punica granatum]OWM66361.1 hypothetical protein CDL15_Pgr013578 [Punica granatum]
MRVPVTTSQQQQNNDSLKPNISVPAAAAIPAGNNHHLSLCSYEPTSVLDLRSPVSSSDLKPPPASSDLTSTTLPQPHHGWGDGDGHHHALQSLDWDSIMKDLDLHDDVSAPAPLNPPESTHFVSNSSDFAALSDVYGSCHQSLAHVPTSNYGSLELGGEVCNNWGFAFDFLEELIQVADCVDSGELQPAQVILARLNHRLRSPAGKPLHRAGFFFKEALQSLLVSGSNCSPPQLSTWPDIVQTIKAYKAFSGISPISMFSHFTANQALLETLDDSPLVHIVDFDIGLGGQYASLMREVAERARGSHAPALRVTAVVAEEYAVETRLIRENLAQFAHDLNLRFSIDFVLNRAFDMLSFRAVKFVDGESLAVHLSPGTIFRLGSAGHVARFLGDLRRLSPKVVVFGDSEPWWGLCGSTGGGSGSFRRSFVSCLEHYSTVFESLDAAAGCGGAGSGGGDWPRKIETYLMQPRINSAVEAAASASKRGAVPPGREVFQAAGMRAVQLSQFADYQAECLLGKVQVRGFHVAKRQAELVLCWHDRALVATSAWRF